MATENGVFERRYLNNQSVSCDHSMHHPEFQIMFYKSVWFIWTFVDRKKVKLQNWPFEVKRTVCICLTINLVLRQNVVR